MSRPAERGPDAAWVRGGSASPGEPPLLLAGLQVWATNVIRFAFIHWELDRGGPVSRARRTRTALPAADWRISQDANDDNVTEVSAGSSGRAATAALLVTLAILSRAVGAIQ